MATAADAPPASPPAAVLPAPVPLLVDKCNYKNRLQELAQRAHQKLPVYLTEKKGDHHQPEFRSTVEVWGDQFSSARTHGRIKDAEQDAARVAYEILVAKIMDADADVTDILGLIDQDVLFCKSILNEFAVKTKATQPKYSVDRPQGVSPISLFVSSVVFDGKTYTGEAAVSKKDAEQKAARAAVKSILATKNTCMMQIIKSKENLITAITASGYNKERGDVSQENCNAPRNAISPFCPIKFVPAVGSAYPTVDQGANTIPKAGPSAQAVPGSKKRKKNITT
ncbi:double-stranded RNA-binding protein 4 [Brachypodium distachyon]|nr:double-stranded RNA-binding protein 4 [Brachypodium distachyon]|eukprot:XP_003572154.1 double-stranded RNA-binding protein 4 [Brachypodium distachyon]